MPLYEYVCDSCGHRFETRQGIRDEALRECPECGSGIRRVVQAVGIVFKGSGFYKTDSRSSSGASVPPGERKTESAPTDGKSEPVAKTDSTTKADSSAGNSSNTSAASTGSAAASSGSSS